LKLLAIAEIADPLSPLVKQGLGVNLARRGDHEASLPYLVAAIEINPNDPFATWMLSHVYVVKAGGQVLNCESLRDRENKNSQFKN
jgi:hypothetical protein